MAIQIAAHFEFAEDWYRRGPVAALVLAYYALVRSVCRAQPELRRCLTRCRHCRIFFFTDPRNTGRKDEPGVKRQDLGCPFGCREAHRRRQSTQRSIAYYREEAGKDKKRTLNAKRRSRRVADVPAPSPAPDPLPAEPPPILIHVRMVTSLLERRPVGWTEIDQMLARALRQHRMVRTRRIDQIIDWLHAAPP